MNSISGNLLLMKKRKYHIFMGTKLTLMIKKKRMNRDVFT